MADILPEFTEFKSNLMLTRQQIKELGIPDHQAELFARISYFQKFNIEAWSDSPLIKFTFPSMCLKLSFQQAVALLNYCKADRLGRELSNSDQEHVDTIRLKVNEIARERFGGGRWFIKLATRSPKDAFQIDTENQQLRDCLVSEIALLPNRSLESLNLAYVKASNRAMGCLTADDALRLFRHSDRIVQDIGKQVEFGERFCDVSIVMREWIDEMVDRPEFEFRCFAHNRKLTAITQYFCWMHFPELISRKEELETLMVEFFNEHVAQAAPFESFVVDFYITKANQVKIIEFNTFSNSAGAGLFSWHSDRELLLNGPRQFRLLENPHQSSRPTGNEVSAEESSVEIDAAIKMRTKADQIPLRWMRWIKAHVREKYDEIVVTPSDDGDDDHDVQEATDKASNTKDPPRVPFSELMLSFSDK